MLAVHQFKPWCPRRPVLRSLPRISTIQYPCANIFDSSNSLSTFRRLEAWIELNSWRQECWWKVPRIGFNGFVIYAGFIKSAFIFMSSLIFYCGSDSPGTLRDMPEKFPKQLPDMVRKLPGRFRCSGHSRAPIKSHTHLQATTKPSDSRSLAIFVRLQYDRAPKHFFCWKSGICCLFKSFFSS